MQRRIFLGGAAMLAALPASMGMAASYARPVIEVWKTPTCGCCKSWVSHLKAEGFDVAVHELGDAEKNAYRRRLGLADAFGSCHTGLIQGYVIEGHVPARDIQRLLQTRPKALGLAVPGMIVGTPGMDGPEYDGEKRPYDVLLVQRDGRAAVFQSYR